MTDTKQMDVNGKEMEKISTNEQEQNGKEGKKMAEMGNEKENVKGTEKYEFEKTNEEEKIPEQKEDSTMDRFLSWWRGKPTGEARLKDDDDDVKDKSHDEKDEKITQNETNGIQNKNEECRIEKEEAREIKSEIIDSKVEVQSDDQSDQNDVVLHHVTKQENQSSFSERRLEKIVEEQKHTGSTAPLALAEEEEEQLDSLDSRPVIDRPVDEPKTSDTVKVEKDSFDFESQSVKDVEEKSEKRKSARVEAFVVLGKPRAVSPTQKSNNEQVNTPSENDELNRDSRSEDPSEVQATHPGGKKDYKQSHKMDEVIEERHDDSRRESVKETWKRLEDTEKETGNKTYRVSYTIRTTTLDRKKNDEKTTEDEEEERLFGKTVLLNSTPQTQHEGPPPEDIESEIKEEHAREDEAATADIDRFFEICQEDAPLAKDETEPVPNEEEAIPQTPDDIFRKLHGWDDEPTDWWTITKKKKEYDEWMKPMKDGTIRRVIIPAVEIPYETSVRFITDWKHREEWDKTFSEIQILKSDKQSKVIYCPVKKRDLTFETLDREETDPPCYVMSWKRQDVIKEGEKTNTLTRKKQKELQFITHTCGIIIRPSQSGDQATKITILCQLEGPIDHVLRNTFLAGHPKTWLSNLKKYYKKQQKGDGKKVVYL